MRNSILSCHRLHPNHNPKLEHKTSSLLRCEFSYARIEICRLSTWPKPKYPFSFFAFCSAIVSAFDIRMTNINFILPFAVECDDDFRFHFFLHVSNEDAVNLFSIHCPNPNRCGGCRVITIGNSSNLLDNCVSSSHFVWKQKREILASFFGAVIACWSIRIGWFALSPFCCWSSHYQKVILRTKTLISHLAESVVIATAFVFAITSHCHHCHHHSEIIHFPQRERQAKNDSFEFRITFAWDACSTWICHVWVVLLFLSAACGWLTVIPFSSHSVSVSMLLLQWMD